MKEQLVILYTIGSFMLGGAEAQLLMLAAGMRRQGHDVHIFVVRDEGPLKASFLEAGVVVHDGAAPAGGTKLSRMLGLLAAQCRLIGLVWRLKPDVVHNFLPLTNFMGSVAGFLARAPRVITSRRALGTHQQRVPMWKYMDWIANALSHVITANSRAVADDAVRRDGADRRKIRVIYNGIDLPQADHRLRDSVRSEFGFHPSTVAIVCVANLIPYKGHHELILAMQGVVRRFPETQLILIGEDRGIGTSLDALIRECGLQNNVRRIGQRRDVPRLLAGMDIGALASHEEGFSNALLEMLHAGLPVVATRVGGNSEALDGMPGCTLVAPNAPSELDAALTGAVERVGLHNDEAEVRREKIIKTYSKQAMLERYLELYQS